MKNKKRGTVIVSALFAVLCLAQTASAFYAPNLQRWVNRDPIGEEGGMNLYAFAENNSISKIDGFGKMGIWPCDAKEWEACFESCQKRNGPDFIAVGCYAMYQDLSIPFIVHGYIRKPFCICARIKCKQRS